MCDHVVCVCVTKLEVTMLCVCVNLYVTKLCVCDKVVRDNLYVTKLCVCVTQLCVTICM